MVKGVTAGDLWATYHPGCPVGPSRLIRMEFPFWDFSGRLRTGALIMAGSSRAALESSMRSAFDDHFPLREVTPVEKYRGDDVASMAAGHGCSGARRYSSEKTSAQAFSASGKVSERWETGDPKK